MRLFYLQGLSTAEVAAELGISTGAVKARLRKAGPRWPPRLVRIPRHSRRPCTVTMTEEAAGWTEVVVSEIRRTHNEDPLQREHVMVLAEGAARWSRLYLDRLRRGYGAQRWYFDLIRDRRQFPYKLMAYEHIETAGSGSPR